MIDPGALDALRNHQQQLDMDGTFVGVSRQALDELLAWYDATLERGTIKYAVQRVFTYGCVENLNYARANGMDSYKECVWWKLTGAIKDAFPDEVADLSLRDMKDSQ